MRTFVRSVLPVLVLAVTAGTVVAQGMPDTQPGILTIFIEEVKVGMNADHEANEAGWPAAFAKSNSPYYYLAMEAMTGPNEIWYVSPYESYAAEGESMKMYESNEELAKELSRLWRADAQYLNETSDVGCRAGVGPLERHEEQLTNLIGRGHGGHYVVQPGIVHWVALRSGFWRLRGGCQRRSG